MRAGNRVGDWVLLGVPTHCHPVPQWGVSHKATHLPCGTDRDAHIAPAFRIGRGVGCTERAARVATGGWLAALSKGRPIGPLCPEACHLPVSSRVIEGGSARNRTTWLGSRQTGDQPEYRPRPGSRVASGDGMWFILPPAFDAPQRAMRSCTARTGCNKRSHAGTGSGQPRPDR
jgi:hypothetical protein